jgi:hypothetical protein
MKKNSIIPAHTWIVLGFVIGTVFWPLIFTFMVNKLQTREEAYLKRLEICLPYRTDKGDYVWRHKFCENAEKEYLELFEKNWKEQDESDN